jgi:hypothetical protein
MADLEEREDGEALVQLGAQSREGLVGEEDISGDLPGDLVDGAGIAQTERIPSGLHGAVDVEDGIEDAASRSDGGQREI